MARGQQVERTVRRDDRFHSADHDRKTRPSLNDVELGGHLDRALELLGATRKASVSSRRMRRISSASCSSSATISLLISTVSSGSTNRLAPLADPPCTMPGIAQRCSARTISTWRPLRSVTTCSCRYLLASRPRRNPSSVVRRRCFCCADGHGSRPAPGSRCPRLRPTARSAADVGDLLLERGDRLHEHANRGTRRRLDEACRDCSIDSR